MDSSASWISLILSNFDVAMFVLALCFMFIHVLVRPRLAPAEIIYRWLALFVVGWTGVYAFIMHVFFQEIAAGAIGWVPSPFETEVGMANLAIGMLGILSFNASYGFRLATVVAATCWFWGDSLGHMYQLIKTQNESVGNAGSWFWMDMILPLLLIICIVKLKPTKRFVR
jgi:hypothetical protein